MCSACEKQLERRGQPTWQVGTMLMHCQCKTCCLYFCRRSLEMATVCIQYRACGRFCVNCMLVGRGRVMSQGGWIRRSACLFGFADGCDCKLEKEVIKLSRFF